MMLGYLLARAGVRVVVLEKHGDFLRDFRGDTIHPSTLEVMGQLGLLEAFLKLPHDVAYQLSARIGRNVVQMADFRHLPTHAKFIAFMPQWDFLDFLAGEAGRFEEFTLIMRAEAQDLIFEGEYVAGVRAATPDGPLEIHADLTVAADGRASILRERADLQVVDLGAPMDVLWMRLPRRADDPSLPVINLDAGRIMVLIARGDYFQCGYVVAKGEYDAIRAAGLDALRQSIAGMIPLMSDRVAALASWDDVKLLTVSVDRPDTLVAARTPLHRRRRPRHVADRGRRHQSGHPGRRRDRQHTGRAIGRQRREACRPVIWKPSSADAKCRRASFRRSNSSFNGA